MSNDDPKFGHADREPSPGEEKSAEHAEMGEQTPEKYEEMAETGAHVKGEGQIEPED